MKLTLSKTQAKQAIDTFFQRASWTSDELKKLKRLAMKYRIKLGAHRKRFCKRCLSPLKGSIRIIKTHKTTVCEKCGSCNRHALRQSHVF